MRYTPPGRIRMTIAYNLKAQTEWQTQWKLRYEHTWLTKPEPNGHRSYHPKEQKAPLVVPHPFRIR